MLMIGVNCSHFKAKAAHLPGHLPALTHPQFPFFGGVGGEKLSTKRAFGQRSNLRQGCILVVGKVGRPRPGLSSDLEACPALPPEVLALAEMQCPGLLSARLFDAHGESKKNLYQNDKLLIKITHKSLFYSISIMCISSLSTFMCSAHLACAVHPGCAQRLDRPITHRSAARLPPVPS